MWHFSDGVLLTTEIFTLDELVQAFDYHHINKSPAVFDIAKLRWMNGEYIKKMDADEFYERALPYMKEVLKKDYNFKKIAGMVQTRIETFPDIPALIDFFEEVPEYDSAMYCHKKMKTNEETSLTVLKKYFRFWKNRKIIQMIRYLKH